MGAEAGWFAIQAAANAGIHVIALCHSSETMEQAKIPNVTYTMSDDLVKVVLDETGEMGVDAVLDLTPKHEHLDKQTVLQCLGIRGRWCVVDESFQLDPPESS